MSAPSTKTGASPRLRIMCIGLSDPQWPVRFGRLCRDYNAEVVYWTGMAKRKKNVERLFPSAVFHVMAQAIRGVPPEVFNNNKHFVLEALDTEVLDAMASYQVTAMKLMDRMDVTLQYFTFEERLRHYYMQVRYWYTVLKRKRPDIVFFPIAPHDHYDYIIYGLCQHLKIHTLMLDRTAIPCRVLFGSTIDECSKKLGAEYLRRLATYDSGEITLSPYVQEYYERMQNTSEQVLPPNVIKKMARRKLKSYAATHETIFQCLRHEYLELRGQIRRRKGLSRADNYLKEQFKPPQNSKCNYLDEVLFRVRAKRIKDHLRKYYTRYQKAPKLDKPYIFVALHYQPERNSVPLGEWYGDQYLMIDMLSKSLPRGWRLYVKEHGQQWSYFSKGERGRTIAFYRDIRKLRGVILVPTEESSFSLIGNAKATATVAGSVGWESIMRGKPALLFGHAWYQCCEGSLRIYNKSDMEAAIAAVENGVAIDQKKVKLFVKSLDDTSMHTLIDTLCEDFGDLTETSMVNNFIGAIGSYLLQTFPGKIKYWADDGAQHTSEERVAKRVALLCPTETVLQEYVALAEQFLEDKRVYPILVVAKGFLASPHLKNARAPIEAMQLPKADPVDLFQRAVKNDVFTFGLLMAPFIFVMYPFRNRTRDIVRKIYKSIPKRARDIVMLSSELALLEERASQILRAENISALIVPDDRVVSHTMAWLAAAKKLGIFSSIVSFAISHPEGGSFMRRTKIDGHHMGKGRHQKFKQEFAQKYPDHVCTTQYGTMLFYNPTTAKVLEKRGMLPQQPWISGGGATDKVYVISEADKQVMRSLGITKEIDAVGQCVMDYIWEANMRKDDIAQELRKKYNLYKTRPILIFAVPHLAEHQICSWEEHERKLHPLFKMLAQNLHVTSLLSLHPRANKVFYRKLAKKYKLSIADEPLYSILPAATVFLATLSSTVRWAALLHIPSIVLKYDIEDTYLDNLTGNVTVNEEDIPVIQGHIERLITDALYYKRVQNSLAEAVKDEIFDGKIRQRIVDDLVGKLLQQTEPQPILPKMSEEPEQAVCSVAS